MHTAIVTVWAIGLVGALVPTVVILKLGLLVIAALRDILRLSTLTGDAAAGLAQNVSTIPQLPDLTGAGAELRRLAEGAGTALGSIARQIEAT